MEPNKISKRLQSVIAQLKLMESGDFSKQILRSEYQDKLEECIELINMRTQEFEAGLQRLGCIDIRKSYRYMEQMSLIIDEELIIVGFNMDATELLHIPKNELLQKPFKILLHESSYGDWEILQTLLRKKESIKEPVRLILSLKEGLIMNVDFKVSIVTSETERGFMFTSFEASVLEENYERLAPGKWKNSKNQKNSPDKKIPTPKSISRAEKLRKIIDSNLQGPAPNIQELADELGTNPTQLKRDFKEVYEETYYQYYQNERKTKIKKLVGNPNIPLKQIANNYNFEDYSNFSHSFKRANGVSPKKFRFGKQDD